MLSIYHFLRCGIRDQQFVGLMLPLYLNQAFLSFLISQTFKSPLSKEDVSIALSSLEGDEALELDGFSTAFW